jgi:D-alanine-D-alanine ligase
MTKKIRVGIIFGGKSAEHEVSINSAKNVMRALDKNKYEVVPIGIGQDGAWLTRGDPLKALTGGEASLPQLLESGFQIVDEHSTGRELIPGTQSSSLPEVDVIFPVLHGPFGEDGTVQGLLELADIPYVGAGVMSSAVGMDKAAMKDLFCSHHLPTPTYTMIKRRDWEMTPLVMEKQIAVEIGYPCFVKPANMGSSVGVHKVHRAEELPAAMNDAALYDRKILVEYAVPNAREIECSVLGNDEPIASVAGEVLPGHEFYDYEDKYIDDSSQLLIPAPIDSAVADRVRDLSIKAFLALDCAGMARVDFLLDRESNELYLNELNTIPGFTKISMYPKLWAASGISYGELIDRLIGLALERHADKHRSKTSYH